MILHISRFDIEFIIRHFINVRLLFSIVIQISRHLCDMNNKTNIKNTLAFFVSVLEQYRDISRTKITSRLLRYGPQLQYKLCVCTCYSLAFRSGVYACVYIQSTYMHMYMCSVAYMQESRCSNDRFDILGTQQRCIA